MIKVFFDGCCEPKNPGGTAAYGFIIFQDKEELYRDSAVVVSGDGATNNVAEYAGLLNALRWLYAYKLTKMHIVCLGDSQLVIEQMLGNWKIKKGVYVPYALKCKEALTWFTNIDFRWIPRLENYLADGISRDIIKKAGIKFRIQKEDI